MHAVFSFSVPSQLRALWYLVDIIVSEPGYDGRGFVLIGWYKNATFWDTDLRASRSIIYFLHNCWPVKAMPFHMFCCPSILIRIGVPVLYAVMTKETRSRMLIHDIPESEILDTLSHYGIMKNMLPMEMGGTVKLDLSEWIGDRCAVEMEQI